MICFTNDTPLTRATKLSDLLDRVFSKIHTIELELDDESAFNDFEEEYIAIKNGKDTAPK